MNGHTITAGYYGKSDKEIHEITLEGGNPFNGLEVVIHNDDLEEISCYATRKPPGLFKSIYLTIKDWYNSN
jgi:hypothetical protein